MSHVSGLFTDLYSLTMAQGYWDRLKKLSGIIVVSPTPDKYSILEKSFSMFLDSKLSSEKLIEIFNIKQEAL